jgi:phosphoglucomutase/phosphomannomutase
MEHAAELLTQKKTLLDRLDELYAEHGYFLEGQISETCTGPRGKAQIQELMVAFSKRPPVELAGVKLAQVDDYATQQVRSLPANTPENQLDGPQGDLMIFHSVDAEIMIRTAVRPSGTEPKIKFYFFAKAACSSPAELPKVQANTKAKLDEFKVALRAWIKSQLK